MTLREGRIGTLAALALAAVFATGCLANSSSEVADDSLGKTQAAASGYQGFAAGSLIIPMDVDYQDLGMLRAYGLVYRLLQNNVPVSWVIEPGKAHSGDDFTTTESVPGTAALDYATATPIPTHGYRGGPFVIDLPDVATAQPIIDAWLADPSVNDPAVVLHETTDVFTGYVKLRLVAAPTIAMVADGNQDVARAYMEAAAIPDSVGDYGWPDSSPDMLTETELAGPGIGPTLAEVVAPTVTVEGAPGATTWSYVIVAVDAFGQSEAANVGTTTTGAAVLAGADRNRLDWTDVLYETSYEIYRTSAGGTPATTGLIGTVAAGTTNFTDDGLPGDGSTPPSTNTSGADHSDGDLFDADGNPAYCQIMSMHRKDWKDDEKPLEQEVVEEYRAFLQFPVHLFAECQAVNAIENHGHFLTDNGFYIGNKPDTFDYYNSDQAFSQIDGVMPNSVGGSEPTYSICDPGDPTTCSAYLDVDIVMITEEGTPTGENDLWMTGYYGGQCSILAEFCDPELAQGKISYLGGHRYNHCDLTAGVTACDEIQGVRLFLNALFEAPCATDLGQPSAAIFKDGPATTTSSTVTFLLTYFNAGPGIATNAVLTDTLAPGVTFVSASDGGTESAGVVTWNLGTLASGESGFVSLDVSVGAFAEYDNEAVLNYVSGVTPFSLTSNTTTTCYHPAGDFSPCVGGGADPNARECGDNEDNDADGIVDYPADPGCHSENDDDELDSVSTPSEVKARVLIVFDTSGSMNWNTCEREFTGGDGSMDCPGDDVLFGECACATCGNTLADDSRMFKVKTGITNVVTSFGEVDYALMRFNQMPVTHACPTQNANQRSGGWQGAGVAPCTGFDGGDVLVTFDPENQYDLIEWLDEDTNYPGTPPPGLDFELRGTGNTPLAGALSDALAYLTDPVSGIKTLDPRGNCRPYRVILVTDGEETCGGIPADAAAALAAEDIYVSVIGFATSDPDVNASLHAIANAGSLSGSDPAILVDDAAALSSEMASIITETILVELCNGIDDDCDLDVDEDFPDKGDPCDNGKLGICLETGQMVCEFPPDVLGGLGLRTVCNADPGIVPGSEIEVCNLLDDDCDGETDEPPAGPCSCIGFELCNGVDDDCNGLIDDGSVVGVGVQCGIDIGMCEFGLVDCVDPDSNPATPDSELQCTGGTPPAISDPCDGADNDCDTQVDEDPGPDCYPPVPDGCTGDAVIGFTCDGLCQPGTVECVSGAPGACLGFVGPGTEVCNGFDDDCDGNIDEDWKPDGAVHTLGDPCSKGSGACEAFGIWACDPADDTAPLLVCTAPDITPGIEICNGLDDDCNDLIDDDIGAPIGDPCGDPGCTPGTLQCVDPDMDPMTPDSEIQCIDAMGGSDEVCNGFDDDCDGLIDEDIEGVGDACYPDGLAGCTGDAVSGYACEGQCQAGAVECIPPMDCVGWVGPTPEVCNGVDDNCDGDVDDMAECPSPDDLCLEGQCVFPCEMSEFPCPFGFLCREILDEGNFCMPDPCLDVTCADNELCNSDTGACEDPCDTISCPPATTCWLGGCFDCFDPGYECDVGQLCILNDSLIGECEADPCFEVACEDDEFCRDGACVTITCEPACEVGETCVEGTCEPDACADVQCPEGEVCRPSDGRCVGDPCRDVTCPAGQACEPGSGDCIDDPCLLVQCPEGTECEITVEGTATCKTPPPPPYTGEDIFAGGTGCSCQLGERRGGPGSAVLLLLLGLVLGRLRRRHD